MEHKEPQVCQEPMETPVKEDLQDSLVAEEVQATPEQLEDRVPKVKGVSPDHKELVVCLELVVFKVDLVLLAKLVK